MKWFLLFLILPILEIYVFFKINNILGIPYTLSIIVFTAILGAIFVKSQAFEIIDSLRTKSINPALLLSHGLILLIAGILLVTPGFITDSLGFLFLIKNIRHFIIKYISNRIIKI